MSSARFHTRAQNARIRCISFQKYPEFSTCPTTPKNIIWMIYDNSSILFIAKAVYKKQQSWAGIVRWKCQNPTDAARGQRQDKDTRPLEKSRCSTLVPGVRSPSSFSSVPHCPLHSLLQTTFPSKALSFQAQ